MKRELQQEQVFTTRVGYPTLLKCVHRFPCYVSSVQHRKLGLGTRGTAILRSHFPAARLAGAHLPGTATSPLGLEM